MPEIELGERQRLQAVNEIMQREHDTLSTIVGCEGRHFWQTCPAFALVRARGIVHTMFVVQRADFDYQIVDWSDEGPAGALHAQVSEPVEHYSDAIEYVAKFIAFEDAENRGEPMRVEPERIKQDGDALICLCGNDPTLDGFACSTRDGVSLEAPADSEIDRLDEWDGEHYRCERCGRVIDQDTLNVVTRVAID